MINCVSILIRELNECVIDFKKLDYVYILYAYIMCGKLFKRPARVLGCIEFVSFLSINTLRRIYEKSFNFQDDESQKVASYWKKSNFKNG